MLKVSSMAVSGQTGPEIVQDVLTNLTDGGIIQGTRPSSILAGISILSDMPVSAQRPDVARGIVIRAIQSNFSASDIQKLPGAMNVAQRRSQMPAAAVLEGVSQQLRENTPASQIIQNLMNGDIGGGPPGNSPPGLENRPGRRGSPQ